jgi:hypothetical protein
MIGVRGLLLFVVRRGFFDGHVLEFTGFEDFAALEALNKLRVLFARHDLNTRMLTLLDHLFTRSSRRFGWYWLGCTHMFSWLALSGERLKCSGILDRYITLSSRLCGFLLAFGMNHHSFRQLNSALTMCREHRELSPKLFAEKALQKERPGSRPGPSKE